MPKSSYRFDIGTYSTLGILGGATYEFQDESKVTFKVSTDMPGMGFIRIGSYRRIQDTVKIEFEPLVNIKYKGKRDSSTMVRLRSTGGEPLVGFPISIFRNNEREKYVSDDAGAIEFKHKPASIDSTYWDWRFEEFGLYPGSYSNFPAIQEFSEFVVTIDTDITSNWPYATDHTSLLIIGDNKLFNGIDYDPESIYPANMGILIKQ